MTTRRNARNTYLWWKPA